MEIIFRMSASQILRVLDMGDKDFVYWGGQGKKGRRVMNKFLTLLISIFCVKILQYYKLYKISKNNQNFT